MRARIRGLAQGEPTGLQRLERDGRKGRERRQTPDFDFAVSKRPGDGGDRQPRLEHPADGDHDVGDMDRHGRIGQDGRRRLARPVVSTKTSTG